MPFALWGCSWGEKGILWSFFLGAASAKGGKATMNKMLVAQFASNFPLPLSQMVLQWDLSAFPHSIHNKQTIS
jgi:hypothetical protein